MLHKSDYESQASKKWWDGKKQKVKGMDIQKETEGRAGDTEQTRFKDEMITATEEICDLKHLWLKEM